MTDPKSEPQAMIQPLSPPGETLVKRLRAYSTELRDEAADEIERLQRELRHAQERCANIAKSLGYAITLLEVEHDWDKCLQYLIAVRDKNDAAASGPKEG